MRNLFFLLIVATLCGSACGTKPPIQIKPAEDGCLAFDIQKLGEYSTMVGHMEVAVAQTGEVVWVAEPLPEKVARIALLELCEGTNPKIPKLYGDKEALRYTVQGNRDFFTLTAGKEYRLTVASPEHRRSATVSFTFPFQTVPTSGTRSDTSDTP